MYGLHGYFVGHFTKSTPYANRDSHPFLSCRGLCSDALIKTKMASCCSPRELTMVGSEPTVYRKKINLQLKLRPVLLFFYINIFTVNFLMSWRKFLLFGANWNGILPNKSSEAQTA